MEKDDIKFQILLGISDFNTLIFPEKDNGIDNPEDYCITYSTSLYKKDMHIQLCIGQWDDSVPSGILHICVVTISKRYKKARISNMIGQEQQNVYLAGDGLHRIFGVFHDMLNDIKEGEIF